MSQFCPGLLDFLETNCVIFLNTRASMVAYFEKMWLKAMAYFGLFYRIKFDVLQSADFLIIGCNEYDICVNTGKVSAF